MSKENTPILDIDTKPAVNSIANVRKAIKELLNEMVGMEEGSDEFLKAANKAGELKHLIDEIAQATRGASSDFGDMIGNISKVGAMMTGSFQSVNAALSLMGVESEEVTKSIKTMQDMMAITLGLSSIDNGVKALKKLQNAITGTTKVAKLLKAALLPKVFLAITAAITALVLIWNKFGDSIKQHIPLLGKLEEAWQKVTGATNDATDAQKKYNDEVAAAEKKVEDLIKNRKVAKLNQESAKSYRDYAEQLKIAEAELDAVVKKQAKPGITKEEWQALQEEGKKYADTIKGIKDAMDALLADENNYIEKEKEKKEKKKEETDAIQQQIDKEYALLKLKKEEDEEYGKSIQYLRDYMALQELELQHIRDLQAAGKATEIDVINLQIAIANTLNEINHFGETKNKDKEKTDFEKEIERIETALAKLNYDFSLTDGTDDDKIAKLEEEIALEEERLQAIIDNGDAETEAYYKQLSAILKLKVELEDLKYESGNYAETIVGIGLIASLVFTSIGQLMGELANGQDQTNKEGFEKAKKMQIGMATMNMLAGITAAIAGLFTTKSGPWDIALAAIQAASIAATGGAQIANIKKQKYEGGSSSSASANLSSAATTFVAPVQYTQDIQGAEIKSALADTRVYVTETDITNTLNRVSVQENENRY